MEWTGITNENEYYSEYFLSEGLAKSLKEQINQWNADETASKKAGDSPVKLAPPHALRRIATDYLQLLEDARHEKNSDPIVAMRELSSMLLGVFHLPENAISDIFTVDDSTDFPLPLLGALYADGKKTQPVLWVFEVAGLDETDPLERKIDPAQFAFGLPEFAKSSKNHERLDFNWNKLLDDLVFKAENAPRWVILAAASEWILIDRTKFNRHSLIRLDWQEIFRRQTPEVLELAAVLLSSSSMIADNGTPLLDHIEEAAYDQAYGVSESLKKSLRRAIELLGNEAATQIVNKARANKKAIDRDNTLAEELTVECLRYMYRILFLLFVESRSDLNYAPVENSAYASAYSIESLRQLESVPLLTDKDRQGTYFHETIQHLFTFFTEGTPNINDANVVGAVRDSGSVPAFKIYPLKGSLFDFSTTKRLNKVVFTNETLQKVILLMSRAEASNKSRPGRISYAHLGIHQLGAVYEALLSYKGFFAKEDLYEIALDPKKKDREFDAGYFITEAEKNSVDENGQPLYDPAWFVKETNENGEERFKIYPKETFIYRQTGRVREKTASYYTPEILTHCLVKYSLKEYWKTVMDKLPDDHAKAEKILQLKICEPAMGSATFLNEAINQLAVRYMEHAQKAAGERLPQDVYANELQRVKMYLADNNVFGVDLNPVAVELGQVSLWLNSLSKDKFVPWFGLQLQCGNSLIGCRRRVYKLADLKQKKWTEAQPYEIGSRQRKDDEIWQFLVPDKDMASYTDPDVKAIYKDQIDVLAKRRKALTKNFSDEELETLLDLSQLVDEYWNLWAEELRELRKETSDPYDIYGHKAAKSVTLSYEEKNNLTRTRREGDGHVETGHFDRLRLLMNYWCSLWFWPIDQAEAFPTRADWLADLSMLLSSDILNMHVSTHVPPQGMLNLEPVEAPQQAEEDAEGRLLVNRLNNPRLNVADAVAERLKFFHWPLRFADIFMPKKGQQAGFDLTFGNPPWRMASWNSANILGDYLPYISFKAYQAVDVTQFILSTNCNGKRFFDINIDIAKNWRSEYEESYGTQNFCKSKNNYKVLRGSKTNLFKVFLPVAWANSTIDGIQGFVHPFTIFDETKGIDIRREAYSRARHIYQFTNELKLFPIHDQKEYTLCIYGKKLNDHSTPIYSIMNLFHPKTIDQSYSSDGSGQVKGIKDYNNNWNTEGHKDRLLVLDNKAFTSIIKVFASNSEAPLLPRIHCQSILTVIEKFSEKYNRIATSSDHAISVMWDENKAKKEKVIERLTSPNTPSLENTIISASHISNNNPYFKYPKTLKDSDWAPIDLEIIPNDYNNKTIYLPLIDQDKYNAAMSKCTWDNSSFASNWKVCYRAYVGSTNGERTLQAAIYPPNVSFVSTTNGIACKDTDTLITLAGNFNSLLFDSYIRILGKDHLYSSVMESLPIVDYKERKTAAYARILGLNCLSTSYSDLWEEYYDDSYNAEEWTKTISKENDFFSLLKRNWSKNCCLRSSLARRQALIELDVLTAQAFGLNLNELLTLYRFLFRVLNDNEESTWYDRNGRIVFTKNSSLSGFGIPRKPRPIDSERQITYIKNGHICDSRGIGFESIKDWKEGYVEKIFPDTTLSDTPVMRTVRYEAPFIKMDREKDYERAWNAFEKRFATVTSDKQNNEK